MKYHVKLKSIEYVLGKSGRPVLQNVLLRDDGVIGTDGFVMAYLKNGDDDSDFEFDTVETIGSKGVIVDGTGFVSLLKDVDTTTDKFIHLVDLKEGRAVFKYFSKTSKTIEERELLRPGEEYPDVIEFIANTKKKEIVPVDYTHLNLKLIERVMKALKPYHTGRLKSIPVVFRFHGEAEPIYIQSMEAKDYEVIVMPMTLDKSNKKSFGITKVGEEDAELVIDNCEDDLRIVFGVD